MIILHGHDDIRIRLIQSLAIFEHMFPKELETRTETTASPETIRKDIISKPQQRQLVLSRQQEDIARIHSSPQEEGEDSTTTTTIRHVRFQDDVQVHEIPSRSEYSPQEKKLLWRSNSELRQIVQRNRREFAAEHWDWKQAVEEDGMFYDKTSEVYIHPVHLGGIADLR